MFNMPSYVSSSSWRILLPLHTFLETWMKTITKHWHIAETTFNISQDNSSPKKRQHHRPGRSKQKPSLQTNTSSKSTTLSETKITPRKCHLPTIDFQKRLLLVSGRESPQPHPHLRLRILSCGRFHLRQAEETSSYSTPKEFEDNEGDEVDWCGAVMEVYKI